MPLWRPLRSTDLPAVSAIAAVVHPAYPEDDAVFADRAAIAPEACFLLEVDGAPAGYVLAHPWRHDSLPALNTVLGAVPAAPDTLYVHDLALLPAARGSGAAAEIVARLARVAQPHGAMSLVAVNDSVPFWTRMGFSPRVMPPLAAKLASYGADACYMTRPMAPHSC
ncbi:GNAT family N-acetyltransferase [Pelagibacterium lacus]|uniref:GNAT family N-acetyltransferase n=1 Tax=Pelagibacterium lacus TaxID=2282655 RepID=A0A369WBF9_9HYPH|nr:GNAT family N-acetyltransferase [Pelagibacterium lacus]RDE09431.1 GNAT family N-acetyltransferase [Pelagibacterium lacus]